jgi:hypothetical protein
MPRRLLLLSLALAAVLGPLTALGQVDRGIVTTGKISTAAPARYFAVQSNQFTVANGLAAWRWVYPFATPARLVDMVVYQVSAGTVGAGAPAWYVSPRDSVPTNLLTTTTKATQASGANLAIDAKGVLAIPAGWTRPVLKTDASVIFTKGKYVEIYVSETDTYTAHPTGIVALVFEPLY